MPAEIRQVEPKRQTSLQNIFSGLHFIGLIINIQGCHNQSVVFSALSYYFHGHLCSCTCCSKSFLKYFIALCSGSIAPGARAQNVFPGPRYFVWNSSSFRSSSLPAPSSMVLRILETQGSPSRQGVQNPQDSCAKKASRFWTKPTGQVLSSRMISVPVPRRLPAAATSV